MNFKQFAFCAFVALAALWGGTAPAAQEGVETGFLDRSLVLEGVEYRYQV